MSNSLNGHLPWEKLEGQLRGELQLDLSHRIAFSTDASVYRTPPKAVVFPKNLEDIIAIVRFADEYQIGITPRAGGTSLAGQAIGEGLIVDVSRHLTEILEVNTTERWVRVQPGVIRDQLNAFLRPLGFWFGPNTSTANRCTMGGMFGNNSCGTTSISVGSTREHVLEAECILADGSRGVFKDLDFKVAKQLAQQPSLEGDIYAYLLSLLAAKDTQRKIETAYPKADIRRRNTGYALDLLLKQHPFTPGGPPINLCTLLAGSEGTLAFTTELKLRILPLPPPGRSVVALHFSTIQESLKTVALAMQHQPFLCELMDEVILTTARQNKEQLKNSQFIIGQPTGLLLVEFRAETDAKAKVLAQQLSKDAEINSSCYATAIITGEQTGQVWELRAAGLGLLANLPGDPKAVACIEDTAVALEDLAHYIEEFTQLMKKYNQRAVYYAHAGAGEIHLRPILNLKKSLDRKQFYDITREVALLVKKYRGSLSGEHGDGRVRAGFLPLMLGDEVYQMLRDLKAAWDPKGIFNPGKIIDAPPMNEGLRYDAEQVTPTFDTLLDFSEAGGLLRLAEKCNGSGDCRKLSGGTMCPSYRATRRELDTTRGRANILREILTREKENPFEHPALAEALDLCLSCKACSSECPSNVDMSSLKAEYLYQKYLKKGAPWRNQLFANIDRIYRFGSYVPSL
ncbi:MAG: FAD-binding and (Fe-S)-binding domain-containing protein, partial [Bacteroidota bacterium]